MLESGENEYTFNVKFGDGSPPKDDDLLLMELPGTDDFLATMLDYSAHTIKNYKRGLARFKEVLGKPIQKANITELRAAILIMKLKYKPSSLHSYCAALRQYLRYIERHADADHLPSFSSEHTPPNAPGIEEMDKILKAATITERALILFLYSTGARVGEVLGDPELNRPPIQIEDLDWQDGKVPIIGKGGRADNLIFWIRRNEALEVLKQYLRGATEGPVFPFGVSYGGRLVRRAGKRVGMKIWPHLMRHANPSNLCRQGADIVKVGANLRHKNLNTTLRYTHILRPDVIEEAKRKDWR